MSSIRTTARAVLAAWNSTVLPVANDGRLQEAMEDLRSALAERVEAVPNGCPYPRKCQFHGCVGECQAAPAAEQARLDERARIADGLLLKFQSAVSNVTRLHREYMGIAMPEDVYSRFATLRDETIPALRSEILAILAAPPAPARQPAPALTVGMLMEAGLMVGSTPDSVGTSNWAVRMLGALRALAVDQPDAPPAPAPTWPEWAEQILKIVREYSGYDGYDDEDGVDLPEEVREALEELTTQIERLEAKAPAPARQEWQPIETAPRDGTHILATLDDSDTCYVICWVDPEKGIRRSLGPHVGWHIAWDGFRLAPRRITHWQPLPAAPSTAAPPQPGKGGA